MQRRQRASRIPRATVVLGLVAAACGPSAGPGPVVPGRLGVAAECVLGPNTDRAEPTVVALLGPVDSAHAPRPAGAAERLVFRQLYETLVRVDCSGRVLPELAAHWRADVDGRRWTFTLRYGARFWDGIPVTAGDVRAAWAGRTADGIARLTVDDDHTLTVELDEPADSPRRFAHPDLAVARPLPESPWPLGSGAFWIGGGGPADGSATLIARPVAPAPGAPRHEIVFQLATSRDGRDLLDAGTVDVFVTDDRATLDYAATLRGIEVRPLAWDRTYVLLAPSRVSGRGAGAASPRFRDLLAREAVQADARGAEPPWWWAGADACGRAADAGPRAAVTPRAGRGRIVFDRADQAAWDLAARIVALAGADAGADGVSVATLVPAVAGGGRVAALGLTADTLAAALAAGGELVYVVALPRRPLDACAAVRRLVGAAPWLAGADLDRALVPLVDVRPSLVTRRGVGGVTADYDGTLRFRP